MRLIILIKFPQTLFVFFLTLIFHKKIESIYSIKYNTFVKNLLEMRKVNLLSLKLLFIGFVVIQLNACKSDNTNKELDLDATTEEDLDKFDITDDENSSVDINALVKNKETADLNEAQGVIQNLLKYCVEDKMQEASKIIAYMGDDASRMFKDHFNYSNASEKSIVNITCDVIKKWLKESSTYEFISYEATDSEIGTIHSVEVMFQKQGVGINRRFFRLVNSKKGMILVAMD
jgi:hypothetical protein